MCPRLKSAFKIYVCVSQHPHVTMVTSHIIWIFTKYELCHMCCEPITFVPVESKVAPAVFTPIGRIWCEIKKSLMSLNARYTAISGFCATWIYDSNERGFMVKNYSALILTQKQNFKVERLKIVFIANKLWQQKSFCFEKN